MPPVEKLSPDPTLRAPLVSVVVPVYNGARSLYALARRVSEAAAQDASRSMSSFELILVNDASEDDSWFTIEDLAAGSTSVAGLDLAHNVGQHAALITGAAAATGRFIVTMDDDLQHPPEAIPSLVRALISGAEGSGVNLVYGTPRSRGGLGARRAGSFLARAGLALRMRSTVGLRSSAFRAFDARLVHGVAGFDLRDINIDSALVAAGARAASMEVDHEVPPEGATRYSAGALMRAGRAVFRGPQRPPGSAVSPVEIRRRVG